MITQYLNQTPCSIGTIPIGWEVMMHKDASNKKLESKTHVHLFTTFNYFQRILKVENLFRLASHVGLLVIKYY